MSARWTHAQLKRQRAVYQRARMASLRAGESKEVANQKGRAEVALERAAQTAQRDLLAELVDRALELLSERMHKPPSRWSHVSRATPGTWYDWVDVETGAIGQCRRDVDGKWHQAPPAGALLFAYAGDRQHLSRVA